MEQPRQSARFWDSHPLAQSTKGWLGPVLYSQDERAGPFHLFADHVFCVAVVISN
jgi:hypothetical protein